MKEIETKDLSEIKGFLNRHLNLLPTDRPAIIELIRRDISADLTSIAVWIPNTTLTEIFGLGHASLFAESFTTTIPIRADKNSGFVHYRIIYCYN